MLHQMTARQSMELFAYFNYKAQAKARAEVSRTEAYIDGIFDAFEGNNAG